MPPYELYVKCTECHGEHPMRVKIFLDTGPDEKQSIAETFQGNSFPPQVSAVRGHDSLCPKTGRLFAQEDDNLIYLVPHPWSRYRYTYSS